MPEFVHTSRLPASAQDAFDWHARPGAFDRLVPPWERIELLERGEGIGPGSRTVLKTFVGPFWRRWVALHQESGAPLAFRDVQTQGPFASWDHLHTMRPLAAGSDAPPCEYEDRVQYALPFAALSHRVAGGWVRGQLERTFAYRHRVVARDLARHASTPPVATMKIAVTGASGLVGSSLVPFLTTGGHEVVRLVRRAPQGADEVQWDPKSGLTDPSKLEGVDAVVHLAGDNIAKGRWTREKKERIEKSRTEGTRNLAAALAKLEHKPKAFVTASAIGFYGADRGDEALDDHSTPGDDFLANVCREWEAAAQPARDAGIRVVNLRLGIVLSPKDGALAKMLTPFKLGAGGKVGSGKQWMSWVSIDDVVGGFHHALVTDSLEGPVNLVAPNPVQNQGFTTALGRVLNRPTLFPLPGFVVKTIFGEMGEALLLGSQRVQPTRLLESGFKFDEPELEGALRHLLGKRGS